MRKITLRVELTLIAPFLTKSSDPIGSGIDAPFARSTDGKFQFSRKLIKGCLRQAWCELAEIDPLFINAGQIDEWLGQKSNFEAGKDMTSVEPVRGQLFFSDFILNEGEAAKIDPLGTTTKISIDEARGAVRENHLLVIESPFRPRESVKFCGEICYFAGDEITRHRVKEWISAGLRWITNLGALENINFGQLEKVEFIDALNEDEPIDLDSHKTIGAETFALVLKPLDPFCISKRRAAENIFESENFIPGGVIKGCVAQTAELIDGHKGNFRELLDNLHLIRFSHAFPSKTRIRPVVPPLSLVKTSDPKFYDVANFREAILIGAEPQSPAFSIDWKKRSDIDSAFGWAYPKIILSVQTAIENNKAKESQLYAYEKINPEGFEWLGRVDLSAVGTEIREEVEKQLRSVVAQNFWGLGKTKARCRVEILEETAITGKYQSDTAARNNKFILTLQTPFLLCNSKDLNEDSGQEDLFQKYKEAWNDISGESLGLSHFFASQSLAGGEYLHKRFRPGKIYHPFLLTDAGSVFVFDVEDAAEAEKRIKSWQSSGLPLPRWAIDEYENDWRKCPYVPENGFGEIVVNLPVHWDNMPAEVVKI